MPTTSLRNIYLSTLEFLRPFSLEERYKIATREIVKVAGADHGSIFLGNEKGDLERVFSNVPRIAQAKPRSRGYAHKSYVNGKLYIVTPKNLKTSHPELYSKGVKSLVLVPLSFNNITIGVIALQYHTTVELNDNAINTLNLFGSLISLGIRNSQLYEQTLEAVGARDLFISLASHELKTPLTTIAAYADQIGRRVNSREMPSEKSVNILNSEIKRLKHMLNEFLAIEQVKTGQLSYNWKEINIIQVVKKAIINFRFSYPGHKVFVENLLSRSESTLQGDSEKLQQVLTNLLSNAARFSPKKIPIVITLDKNRDFIRIQITDFGTGILKKDQGRVFDEFFKASNNHKDGMGIGLYLVKKIIERHQGKITLVSRLHKGTTVTVELPRKLYD